MLEHTPIAEGQMTYPLFGRSQCDSRDNQGAFHFGGKGERMSAEIRAEVRGDARSETRPERRSAAGRGET